MKDFEKELLIILEVDDINDDDVLEEFEEFDSLTILSIIALVGKMFNKTISVQDVKNAKTIGGLKELVK